ncbi:hypothetical protein JB92DRAFT_3140076 [Gautieria morchelliformis]|nr:hypothetical protein JB92DRAFT_3140076 [Gautieria morchelliformis]
MLDSKARNAVSRKIALLNQSLSELEPVEAKLSAELNEIRARIEELRNQRAALESRVAMVWSLPNEILSHIFELGVINEEYMVPDPRKDDHTGHLPFNILVSHVSHTFREVAIRTPKLWSQVHISNLDPTQMDFLRACLQRSSGLKIDISLDCEEDDFDAGFDAGLDPIRLFMNIVVPHIHRFRIFHVRICGPQALYLVMQFLNKPAPELEVLELCDTDYEHTSDEDDPYPPPSPGEPLTLFGGITPKLEAVTLVAAHVAWTECSFAGLTKLHLGYHTRNVRPTYEVFKAMINASPTLHTLHLDGSAPFISEDATESSLYPPLQMERLKNLHISRIPSDTATPLIALFNAPNLTSLSLTDLNSNDYSEFFRRIIGPPTRFPALTNLKLASIEAADTVIEDLLRVFSKLTYLAMYFDRMPASWLRHLEPSGPETGVLCPKLECLKCVGASPHVIKKLLEKRRDVGYPIPTLQVDKTTALGDEDTMDDEDTMKWLREHVIVEIIEPSEFGSDDMDESGSEWLTGEEDEIGGFPYFSMEGFTDEEEGDADEGEDEDEGDEGDEDEDASDIEVDASGSEGG